MSTEQPAVDLAIPAAPAPTRTTPNLQRAMIAERLAGVAVKDIATRYKVDPATVWRICKDAQKSAKDAVSDWRSGMRVKAIRGVNAGLDSPDDPYKRATIGVSVLKGLGDFAGDTQVSVTTLVSSAPQGVDSIVASLREVIELEQVGDTPTGSEPAPLPGYVESVDPASPTY